MPRLDGAQKRRRDRMIVSAARAGVPYPLLAKEYGLSRSMICIICTKAGVRQRAAWTEEERREWGAFRRELFRKKRAAITQETGE